MLTDEDKQWISKELDRLYVHIDVIQSKTTKAMLDLQTDCIYFGLAVLAGGIVLYVVFRKAAA